MWCAVWIDGGIARVWAPRLKDQQCCGQTEIPKAHIAELGARGHMEKLAGTAYVSRDQKQHNWWHVESNDSDPDDGGVIMVTFTGPWAREMAIEWATAKFAEVEVDDPSRPPSLRIVK